MKLIATVAAILSTAALAPATAAQDAEASAQPLISPLRQQAMSLVTVFNGEAEVESVFDSSMLAAVPPAQLQALMAQLTSTNGRALSVESIEQDGEASGEIVLRLERALVVMDMVVASAPPSKVTGLRITDVQPLNEGPEAIEADLAKLDGRVSAWFGPLDGEASFAFGETDTPFAIGSTFKLYVLSALASEIATGERAWDDVYRLSTRSLPSGDMRDWPQGAPITLHTLATLMISKSDNTATDALIDVLGREAIEAEVTRSGSAHAAANLPFLKTSELFRLKSVEDGAVYADSDIAKRRAILAELAAKDFDAAEVGAAFDSTRPTRIDEIEWFASVDDTAALLGSLALPEMEDARAIMAVNTVFPAEAFANWKYVGYKGGSEPGVLNLTWLLQDRAGSWHMLTLHWNDSEAVLEEAELVAIARRILALD